MMLSRDSDDSCSLSQLQRWMQSVIKHPAGIEAGANSESAHTALGGAVDELDDVICRSQRLSSVDRLRVYGNAYFARLLECLRAEFPAMVKALGEEAFDGLAFGYLLEHPSQSYTLSRLAAALPGHLARTRPAREADDDANSPDFADFLIDLAILERTYSEVFDGPGPEQSHPLKPSDLEGLSVEQFAESRLVLHDCVRLLSLRFPVHEYATAIRHGEEADFPEGRPTSLVVTRRDYIVRRFEVSPSQFELLAALQRGSSVGEALLAIQRRNETDAVQLATDLRCWFLEWTSAPLFQRLMAAAGP
jgi:putative DNA-binding protein